MTGARGPGGARAASGKGSGRGARPRSLWVRAVAVRLPIAAAETAHGVLRGLFLVPAVGATAAGRIGFAVGCAIVTGIALASCRRLGARTATEQRHVGTLWCALMLGFELAIGRAQGFGWDRIAAELDPSRGGLMGFGLLLVAAAPRLAARVRGPQRVSPPAITPGALTMRTDTHPPAAPA